MKSNLEHLLALIHGQEEAIEFANAIGGELDDANDEINEKEKLIADMHQEKADLNDKLDELENQEFGESIDCGIGVIKYETEGSIDLNMIMGALRNRIEKYGYKKVLNLLEVNMLTV